MKRRNALLIASVLLAVQFLSCKKEEFKNYEMTHLGGLNLKGLANSLVGTPRAVLVNDESGAPKEGVEVAFTVVSGGGSIDNSKVLTNADGIAFVNWTLGSNGAQTLRAEVLTSKGNLIKGAPVLFESGIVEEGTFTDPRDGEVYKTISIGGQTWLAENLRYNAIGSRASGFNTTYNATYGRYYDWYVAQTACPPGWHLPSRDEWTTLETNLGIRTAQDYISSYPRHLKSTSMWQSSSEPNSAGTNALGFNVFPAGYVSTSLGDAVDYGYTSSFWTSTTSPDTTSEAWNRNFSYDSYGIGDSPYWNKLEYNFSVRCVKD